MSERTTRLLAVLALSMAVVALLIAGFALQVARDRTDELERVREALERANSATAAPGAGRPSLPFDPGDDER